MGNLIVGENGQAIGQAINDGQCSFVIVSLRPWSVIRCPARTDTSFASVVVKDIVDGEGVDDTVKTL